VFQHKLCGNADDTVSVYMAWVNCRNA